MRGFRRKRWAGVAAFGALSLVSALPAAAAPGAPDLRAAAANRTGMSVGELDRVLAADHTLSIGPGGALRAVDPARHGAEALLAPVTALSTDDVFALHSRPGSSRVIYLDFNGHTIPGNTAWGQILGSYCDAKGFSLDSNTSDFTAEERTRIHQVWEIVAEDYAPFNVDVTTADPGAAAITRSSIGDNSYGTRALITSTTSRCGNDALLWDACGSACSGSAFVGVFDDWISHSFYQPALIFAEQNIGTSGIGFNNSARSIAESISHEVGHNAGLLHDGSSEQCDGNACGYDDGHGAWSPIMGFADFRPIAQWSQGEYRYANNFEDDFDVMQDYGVVRLADDYGNWIDNPTKVSSPFTKAGMIADRSDIDVFAIDAAAGPASFSAHPSATSPNLDIRLELRNANFTLVASNDPPSAFVTANVASGLSASITRTLGAGRYYLVVDGTRFAKPATTGYSDYASVGPYTVSGLFVASGVTNDPILPAATAPDPPTDLVATPVKLGIELSWRAPDDQGTKAVTQYEATVTAPDGASAVGIAQTTRTTAATTILFAPVNNDTAYKFSVKAIGWGTSAASTPVIAMRESSAPVVSMSAPSARFTLDKNIPVSWSATDVGTGVSDYDVAQRGGAWNGSMSEFELWKEMTTATSGTYGGSYGSTYCFQTRATDNAENAGFSPGETCTAIPLASGHLTYSSDWIKIDNSGAFAGTYRKTTTKGASVSKTGIRAKRFSLISTKCTACGKAHVYWNGAFRTTIDLNASSTQRRQIIPLFTFSTVSQPGTLKLVNASSGKSLLVEGLGVSKF
jgi:hypothetical protein